MNDTETKDVDVLLALYLDNIQYARHHETLRSTMTNFILVIGAALGVVIAMDDKITILDVPFFLFQFYIGVFGAVFSFKHFERFHSHYARARELRAKMDEITGLGVVSMKTKADRQHAARFKCSHKWTLSVFWAMIPLSVSLLGISLWGAWFFAK